MCASGVSYYNSSSCFPSLTLDICCCQYQNKICPVFVDKDLSQEEVNKMLEVMMKMKSLMKSLIILMMMKLMMQIILNMLSYIDPS